MLAVAPLEAPIPHDLAHGAVPGSLRAVFQMHERLLRRMMEHATVTFQGVQTNAGELILRWREACQTGPSQGVWGIVLPAPMPALVSGQQWKVIALREGSRFKVGVPKHISVALTTPPRPSSRLSSRSHQQTCFRVATSELQHHCCVGFHCRRTRELPLTISLLGWISGATSLIRGCQQSWSTIRREAERANATQRTR